MRILRIATLALAALTSCRDPMSPEETLLFARDRWDRLGPASYSYVLDHQCFCFGLGPVTIVVTNGTVTSRTNNETGQPTDRPQLYPAIDGLLARIDSAFARGATINGRYHPGLGYPERVFIDNNPVTADDEVTLVISQFRKR